ncbi:MAG: peptide ABC transporter substrate-binding protein [Chloroflexi bacterium]|nr:peptide ABC transporter substrate-binding protein [Dehalococcoidia bacterium]MCO5201666.1 peptide ABC transporter substrate-binding protein [Chloroflexota bacterium]MCZ7576382.1 peptide ABC transporter substrate-binding protein [Dehalococcoidia bacterium]
MSNRMLTLMMGVVAFLILAVGVVFVVALAGGGGDDDNGSPASPSNNDDSPRSTGKGICSGKSLIVPGNDPNTVLDPIQVGDVSTSEYVVEIFGGLVTLDPELNVQPDIAQSWEVTNGGKTYTFKLRDDVVFHTGNTRRVTAEDVKYSIERAADPVNASPTVRAYLGNIVGVRDRFENKASSVSGVKVIDERTIQIDLIEPSDFFLSELTYPVAFVVDREQIESNPRNWTQKPNGTGPFRLAEFKPAERIRIVKNDRYHLGAPKLDEVIFELGGGSLLTRYENDEIHIGGFPASLLDSVKDGSNKLAKEYRAVPNMAVFYFTLNPQQPPFDDPKVRQAFAMTLDRETINSVLLYDAYRVADGFLPPDMPGYTESVHSYEYNVARAKQLLSESRYAGNMPRVVLTFSGSGAAPGDLLVAIQQGWQDALGVNIELQAIDTSAFLREQRRGTFQMHSDGWSADYPDPEDFLGKLFASDSTLNYTRYKNDEVDKLLLAARVETDRTKRYQMYAEAEQLIMDDAVVIPTFWPVDHVVVKPCVHGYPDVSMTVPKYRFVEIKAE